MEELVLRLVIQAETVFFRLCDVMGKLSMFIPMKVQYVTLLALRETLSTAHLVLLQLRQTGFVPHLNNVEWRANALEGFGTSPNKMTPEQMLARVQLPGITAETPALDVVQAVIDDGLKKAAEMLPEWEVAMRKEEEIEQGFSLAQGERDMLDALERTLSAPKAGEVKH